MIKKFYCKFCNDGIARTRNGIRKHLGEEHLRNDFFGTADKLRDKEKIKLSRVRIEEF